MAAGGHQYYGGSGAPLVVPGPPERAAAAWRSQRARMREWFAGRAPDQWAAETRCEDWSASDMAQHLISATKFLNFTLSEAADGRATRLLEGFDPKAGPAAIVANAPRLSPQELLDELAAIDARVDAELDAIAGEGWMAPAESPPGQVPAYLAVTHMLFDSWVHERDLMLPVGGKPLTDPEEAAVVAAYVFGLTGIARAEHEALPPARTILIEVTDIDLTLQVDAGPDGTNVVVAATSSRPNASGSAGDLVDFTTGREPSADLRIDEPAGTYLRNLVARMN